MRWVWIGDSITEAMAEPLALGYSARGDEAFIYHNSGWSVARWLAEGAVDSTVLAARPAVVVVALGTNDTDAPQERFVRNVKELTERAKASNARVVWIGPFNSRARNDWGKAAAVAPWVDGMKLAAGLARTPDGVHFTAEGSRELAQRAATAVDTELAELLRPPKPPSRGSVVVPLVLGLVLGGAIVAGVRLSRRSR